MSIAKQKDPVKSQDGASACVRMRALACPKGVSLTPAGARQIIDELNFHGQRKIRQSRVQKHLDRLRSGTWRDSFHITFASLPDGHLWLIDGQHRCAAISEHTTSAKVVFDIVEVSSEDEARLLYAGFDEADSKRSTSEVLDAVGVGDSLGLPRHFATRVFSALPILNNGLEPLSGSAAVESNPELFSIEKRLDSIGSWGNEARAYWSVISPSGGTVRRKLMSAGCIAVGMYTFRHQAERAKLFWGAVVADDGLRKTDPRKTLISDFTERNLAAGSIRQSVQGPAQAWNAWNEGRELKIIKCVTGGQITVWGTPLAKGRK